MGGKEAEAVGLRLRLGPRLRLRLRPRLRLGEDEAGAKASQRPWGWGWDGVGGCGETGRVKNEVLYGAQQGFGNGAQHVPPAAYVTRTSTRKPNEYSAQSHSWSDSWSAISRRVRCSSGLRRGRLCDACRGLMPAMRDACASSLSLPLVFRRSATRSHGTLQEVSRFSQPLQHTAAPHI